LNHDELFRDDSYLSECAAVVKEVNDRGGIVLDRTVFYPTGGGQPGDSGVLVLADSSQIAIATTVKDRDSGEIVHVPADGQNMPAPGDAVTARIDMDARENRMRAHTAMHLMCALVPFPVTGGSVGDDGGRLDFAIDDPDAVNKADLTDKLNVMIAQNHPVAITYIDEEELEANPEMVRTMSVQPPRGAGTIRVIEIGENGAIDRQPCGGTHVRATGEIGGVEVTKIEKKGKMNRRIRFRLT